MLNLNFFPCSFAMIRDAALSCVPVSPMCCSPHLERHLGRTVRPVDRSSRTRRTSFYLNLYRSMWTRKKLPLGWPCPCVAVQRSCNPLVDKSTPYPVAWGSQHGRTVDNDAITPGSKQAFFFVNHISKQTWLYAPLVYKVFNFVMANYCLLGLFSSAGNFPTKHNNVVTSGLTENYIKTQFDGQILCNTISRNK